MFTAEQLKAAHSQVKSGADFPAYIRNIKELGVVHYETFVADGRTEFYGPNGHRASWPAKYAPLSIAETSDEKQFSSDLKAHQQGQSDYLSFIAQSAALGVEKWIVRLDEMSCTYYDKAGNEILVEEIPA